MHTMADLRDEVDEYDAERDYILGQITDAQERRCTSGQRRAQAELEELSDLHPVARIEDVRRFMGDFTRHAHLYDDSELEDLAREKSSISRHEWVYDFVDWEKAAEDLAEDMTEVTIEGTTYYSDE